MIPRALPLFNRKDEVGNNESDKIKSWDEFLQRKRPRRIYLVDKHKLEPEDCWSETDPDFVPGEWCKHREFREFKCIKCGF